MMNTVFTLVATALIPIALALYRHLYKPTVSYKCTVIFFSLLQVCCTVFLLLTGITPVILLEQLAVTVLYIHMLVNDVISETEGFCFFYPAITCAGMMYIRLEPMMATCMVINTWLVRLSLAELNSSELFNAVLSLVFASTFVVVLEDKVIAVSMVVAAIVAVLLSKWVLEVRGRITIIVLRICLLVLQLLNYMGILYWLVDKGTPNNWMAQMVVIVVYLGVCFSLIDIGDTMLWDRD